MADKKKPKKGICLTKFCRNAVNNSKYCSTCRSRQCRERDPIRASFVTLKNNCIRRQKPFDLTLDYFRKFCYRSKYIKGKGRYADNFSIDRKDPALGYVKGNIHVLLNRDNNAKRVTKWLEYDYKTRYAMVHRRESVKEFLF